MNNEKRFIYTRVCKKCSNQFKTFCKCGQFCFSCQLKQFLEITMAVKYPKSEIGNQLNIKEVINMAKKFKSSSRIKASRTRVKNRPKPRKAK